MRWLSDFFRLAWGFLYWNARKSAFRLRGARGRCPCQHASDSGRAGETSCAAVVNWNSPERFRRLCPLLQKDVAGHWRCSVNREDVRPFWGRAFLFFGASFLVLYLVATLGAFAFFRQVGYALTYRDVAWPPAWSRFNDIRADFFVRKYHTATLAGDMQAALMSLSTAYALRPENYVIGRQLAQFWQAGQPELSDQIYRRLLAEHADENENTAQAWFRALLARGNFAGVESLAAERIVADGAQTGAWINAFLFANRRTGDADARLRLLKHSRLPNTARFSVALADELASPQLDAAQARAVLLNAAENAPDGLAFFNVCRQLIARGFAQDALQWLDRRAGLLGPRDVVPLRLDALASLGWDASRRSEVETLLIGPAHPVVIELLSAHLIRYPNSEILGLVLDRLERDPLPQNTVGYQAALSVFCAAGAGRDAAQLHRVAERIKAILRDEFRGLDAIGDALASEDSKRRLGHYLPALQPLPLEVSYALFDHYDPAP